MGVIVAKLHLASRASVSSRGAHGKQRKRIQTVMSARVARAHLVARVFTFRSSAKEKQCEQIVMSGEAESI